MKLYRIYTPPENKQLHSQYLVWADSSLRAEVIFNKKFKHHTGNKIQSICLVRDEMIGVEV